MSERTKEGTNDNKNDNDDEIRKVHARFQSQFHFTFSVAQKPVFSIHPKSISAYLDEGVAIVTLSCQARGAPRPVIGWLRNNSTVKNGIVIQNGSISTLKLVFTKTTEEPADYRCVASNSMGSTVSTGATVTIFKRNPTTPDKQGITYNPCIEMNYIIHTVISIISPLLL